jgi:hypothetical protein
MAKKQIYDISANLYISPVTKKVTVETQEEADAMAKALAVEALTKEHKITANGYARLSDDNFCFQRGAIYLIKYHNSFVPAKCVSSWYNQYKKHRCEHRFKYLGNGRDIHFTGEKDSIERVSIKLCDDAGVLKELCQTCVAKFMCFTDKKNEE